MGPIAPRRPQLRCRDDCAHGFLLAGGLYRLDVRYPRCGRREPPAFGHSLTRLNEAGAKPGAHRLDSDAWRFCTIPTLPQHVVASTLPAGCVPACLPTKARTPEERESFRESVVDQEAEERARYYLERLRLFVRTRFLWTLLTVPCLLALSGATFVAAS